jgi:lipopolysaccharide transport system ATP-binding protein
MPVRNDDATWVQLEADVRVPDAALNVGYELLDEAGKMIYWSCTTDGGEREWPRPRNGRVVLRSRFPSRLLNEGDYQLRLMASLHCRQWLCPPGVDAPTIHLSIRGGLSDSPFWLEKRPGVVAPVIPWDCHQDDALKVSA